MTTLVSIPADRLIEIPSPYVEPRIAFQTLEPRKVNNLTLIDGKTFLSTTVVGDITPAGAPDVGFFHDGTSAIFCAFPPLKWRATGSRRFAADDFTGATFWTPTRKKKGHELVVPTREC